MVSNKTYDMLKLVALLLVPLIAFISACGDAVGYDTTVIVKIATAADVLLGAVVKILSDYHAKHIADGETEE